MKTRINFCIFCLAAISFVTMTSCDDKDGDTVKPVINLIEPGEGDIVEIGDEHGIHLDMTLSDNEMLREYKVDIHPVFDGHSHSHELRAPEPEETTVDFYFQKSWSVAGKKNTPVHHHEIMVPANATPGEYHFMVYCTDAAGNEEYAVRTIVLSTEGGGGHSHGE